MKALIWIGCLFVFTILRVLAEFVVVVLVTDPLVSGTVSGVVTIAMLIATISIAKRLCKKHDVKKKTKKGFVMRHNENGDEVWITKAENQFVSNFGWEAYHLEKKRIEIKNSDKPANEKWAHNICGQIAVYNEKIREQLKNNGCPDKIKISDEPKIVLFAIENIIAKEIIRPSEKEAILVEGTMDYWLKLFGYDESIKERIKEYKTLINRKYSEGKSEYRAFVEICSIIDRKELRDAFEMQIAVFKEELNNLKRSETEKSESIDIAAEIEQLKKRIEELEKSGE